MSDAYEDTVHHLAKKLSVAVHNDEHSDDGCDIGAGFLGTEVSNFVREIALTMHQQQKEIDKLDRQLNNAYSTLRDSAFWEKEYKELQKKDDAIIAELSDYIHQLEQKLMEKSSEI